MSFQFPDSVLKGHSAVVGMTGSGKSSTTRLLVEQVAEAGARVCVLDAVKSDWWGVTSSASGKRAGLPFQILGGPHGHVPLHASAGKAIGEIVGTGKLPLSIIDMADFGPGDLQRFFVDFAQSLWKHQKGVVYLVIEEAHEFAPKERAGFGAENMAIHWAKKLATGSRTKGIRLIVATQRVQALHNAVLGSCKSLVAHQLFLDADQKPVLDWVKNISKEKAAFMQPTLATQSVGTGWLCSQASSLFEQVKFPKFKTYDNTATPDDDTEHAVTTAPVDRDKLRAIIGDAVKIAEADDPKSLRAANLKLQNEKTVLEAARESLTQQLDAAIAEKAKTDPRAIKTAQEQGFEQAKKKLSAAAKREANERIKKGLLGIAGYVKALVDTVNADLAELRKEEAALEVHFTPPAVPVPMPVLRSAPSVVPQMPSRAKPVAPIDGDDRPLGAERKPLGALAAVYPAGMSEAQWAVAAVLKRSGGTWSTYVSRLRKAGRIAEHNGLFYATEKAIAELGGAVPQLPPPGPQLVEFWAGKISAVRPMLKRLEEAYPAFLDRETLAADLNLAAGGGTFGTYLSRIRQPGLIEEQGQQLRLSPNVMGTVNA